jgi:23S rRNA (pseudouridine1915-N3)-methyltransferase
VKNIVLIVVGRLKSKELEILEIDYLKRFKKIYLKIIETKSLEDHPEKEGELVALEILELQKKASFDIVLLEEKGKLFNSPDFSNFLFEELAKNVIFVIGGSSGHGSAVLKLKQKSLSLSPLTYPHKLARLLFIEQLYRAETIFSNHPYHK